MDTKRVEVRYFELGTLLTWPGNPKTHNIQGLRESMRRWGFTEPLVRDETSGRLVGGHGRLEALEMMRDSGESAPTRIEVRDGQWYVPVLCGIAFTSIQEAEAYLIGVNQLTMSGGWDDELLMSILREYNDTMLLGTGFSVADVGVVIGDESGQVIGIDNGLAYDSETYLPVTRKLDDDENDVKLPHVSFGRYRLPVLPVDAQEFQERIEKWVADNGSLHGLMHTILYPMEA